MTDGRAGVVTIPTLGTRLTLRADWTFTLYGDSRNTDFWDVVHGPPVNALQRQRTYYAPTSSRRNISNGEQAFAFQPTTLRAGTVLRVDRLYIRRGKGGFDSVSFVCESSPGVAPVKRRFAKNPEVGRFWAPLAQVNTIVGEWDVSTLPTSPE